MQQQLNNLDIIILITAIISALIALNRGFIKECLSVTGWILSAFALIYLLPVINPYIQMYIEDDIMAATASAFAILIVFFIVWIYLTSKLIGKVRTSRLSAMDRLLGLIFGIVRAFLLVILFNIMVNWVMTEDEQPEVFWNSGLYQFAGKFAAPVEKLIPQETRDLISRQTSIVIKADDRLDETDSEDLFQKLSQPKIEKKKGVVPASPAEGYKQEEQKSMERLIEMNVGE